MAESVRVGSAECLFAAFEVSEPGPVTHLFSNTWETTNIRTSDFFNISLIQTHTGGFGQTTTHLLFVVTISLR